MSENLVHPVEEIPALLRSQAEPLRSRGYDGADLAELLEDAADALEARLHAQPIDILKWET